jgi:hypothetical protein
VVVAVSAPVLCVPLAASVPLQPPLAAHAVALVEFQLSVVDPPLSRELAVAVSDAVGTGLLAGELTLLPQADRSSTMPLTKM